MVPEDDLERVTQLALSALDELKGAFEANPVWFFTEADLGVHFITAFNRLDWGKEYTDIEGKRHKLTHTEYPTPFRCNMKDRTFTLEPDEKRTPKGGKYKRGHFDVVVLSPSFISHVSTRAVLGQDYEILKREALPWIEENGPSIAFGLEVQLSRKRMRAKTADNFAASMRQDAEKLSAACDARKGKPSMNKSEAVGFLWEECHGDALRDTDLPYTSIRYLAPPQRQ